MKNPLHKVCFKIKCFKNKATKSTVENNSKLTHSLQ